MAITFGINRRVMYGGEDGTTAFTVETPNELVPNLVGYSPQAVSQGLKDAAARAGIVDFDFGPAIERAASEHSTGWMTGAGPLQIINAILADSGSPQLSAQRVTDPGAIAADAAYGVSQENALRAPDKGFFSEALTFAKEALTSPPALVFYALAGANAAGLIGTSSAAPTVLPAAVESGGAFGATEGLGMAGSYASLSANYVPLTAAGSLLTQAATSAATSAATTTAATSAATTAATTATGATLAGTAAALGKGVLAGITGAVANALSDNAQASEQPTVITPPQENTTTARRLVMAALGVSAVGLVAYFAKRKKK